MLRITGCAWVVKDAQLLLLLLGDGRSGPSLLFHSLHGSEDAEHDIMLHHVKVPGDHGPLVGVLNQHFVHLQN